MASSRALLLAADSITMHLAAVVAIWASPDIESMSAPVNVCASFVRAFQIVRDPYVLKVQ
jgi:hypothetical protein